MILSEHHILSTAVATRKKLLEHHWHRNVDREHDTTFSRVNVQLDRSALVLSEILQANRPSTVITNTSMYMCTTGEFAIRPRRSAARRRRPTSDPGSGMHAQAPTRRLSTTTRRPHVTTHKRAFSGAPIHKRALAVLVACSLLMPSRRLPAPTRRPPALTRRPAVRQS